MTLPASGPISIQDLRNEYYAGGGPTDLAHFGNLVLGRANCSLSEFYGRSSITYYAYATTFPNHPNNAINSTFATAHGTFWWTGQNTESGGVNTQYLGSSSPTNNPAAWAKLIRVDLWNGFSFTPAQIAALQQWTGNFGGGAMTWYFNL